MTIKQLYYVSLADKIISESKMEERETLEIMATTEEVSEIRKYMNKDEESLVDERKALFLLIYKLGTEETKNTLSNLVK